MKYLIVNGCSYSSYTYGRIFDSKFNYELQKKITQWPIILADKLGMKLINLALGGSGNDGIYSRTCDVLSEIDTKDIGLVCHMWTEAHRRDYTAYNAVNTSYALKQTTDPMDRHIPHQALGNNKFFDHIKDLNFMNGSWCGHYIRPGSYEDWINDSFRNYFNFQTLCESYNIPYISIQGLNLVWNHYKLVEGNKTAKELWANKWAWNDEQETFCNYTRRATLEYFEQYDVLKNSMETIPSPTMRPLETYHFVSRNKKEITEAMKNSIYYDKIKNFINWPIDKPNDNVKWTLDDLIDYDDIELAKKMIRRYGFDPEIEIENNIQQRFLRYQERHKSFLWPEVDFNRQDWHPNQETQFKIADYIYENI